MYKTLKLILPVLFPSWRFFDVIAPSPRIEFTVLKTKNDTPYGWHEFRSRPIKLSFFEMLKRMFWNRQWNEDLFLVSCAEKIMSQPNDHSIHEIIKRIETQLRATQGEFFEGSYLQFRLVFLYREGTEIKSQITFISSPSKMEEGVINGI
jgi:hypothetical protein